LQFKKTLIRVTIFTPALGLELPHRWRFSFVYPAADQNLPARQCQSQAGTKEEGDSKSLCCLIHIFRL